jgi:HK97 family phage prohead protease
MTDLLTAAPVDNLIRLRHDAGTMEMRVDAESDGRTLHGHFSVFDAWYRIDSTYEGRFLERVAPGAFRDAFRDPKNIRVLYEHGQDPSIGNKPIANPTVMREDSVGAYYEAELFDASYVNDLIPALRAGQLGASFRFRVNEEEWVDPKRSTEHNPERLPERTIRSVTLYEFGPVTWGASPAATAGVRSGTDSFIDRLLHDPSFVARFTERVGLSVVEKVLQTVPTDGRPEVDESEPTTDGLARTRTRTQRMALAVLTLNKENTA